MDKLQPCPFCGTKVEMDLVDVVLPAVRERGTVRVDWSLRCHTCGASLPRAHTDYRILRDGTFEVIDTDGRADLVARWNHTPRQAHPANWRDGDAKG
jgi:hypothetical protein